MLLSRQLGLCCCMPIYTLVLKASQLKLGFEFIIPRDLVTKLNFDWRSTQKSVTCKPKDLRTTSALSAESVLEYEKGPMGSRLGEKMWGSRLVQLMATEMGSIWQRKWACKKRRL